LPKIQTKIGLKKRSSFYSYSQNISGANVKSAKKYLIRKENTTQSAAPSFSHSTGVTSSQHLPEFMELNECKTHLIYLLKDFNSLISLSL